MGAIHVLHTLKPSKLSIVLLKSMTMEGTNDEDATSKLSIVLLK